jgi:hypothetical protein
MKKKTGIQKSCETVPKLNCFEINSPFWVLGMNFGIFTDTLVFQHGTVGTEAIFLCLLPELNGTVA